MINRPKLEREDPFLAQHHPQCLQASQTHRSWQWDPPPPGRDHQVQKGKFCLQWCWSTPKEHQQLLAKIRLYLPCFSWSFLPYVDLFLLNNKPFWAIPGVRFTSSCMDVSAPSAPQLPLLPAPAHALSGHTSSAGWYWAPAPASRLQTSVTMERGKQQSPTRAQVPLLQEQKDEPRPSINN